jgi:hypothetical protein
MQEVLNLSFVGKNSQSDLDQYATQVEKFLRHGANLKNACTTDCESMAPLHVVRVPFSEEQVARFIEMMMRRSGDRKGRGRGRNI